MTISAALARAEAAFEFVARFRQAQEHAGGAGKGVLPVLSSECPGFVLFMEKTHGSTLLPHLSRVQSVQGISGTLVKGLDDGRSAALIGCGAATQGDDMAAGLRVEDRGQATAAAPGRAVWHAAIMPCPDKKLESAREELSDGSGTPQGQLTDCVVTTSELLSLLRSRNVTLGILGGWEGGGRKGGKRRCVERYVGKRLLLSVCAHSITSTGVSPSNLAYPRLLDQS
jgi:iron only hydrogenase large subunit-like protein